MDRTQLYAALVDLCQEFGTTTGHTYDLLNAAIDSIVAEPEPNVGINV